MRLMVNNGPVVRRLIGEGYGAYLGHLFTPAGAERTAAPGLPVALDNGAYSGFDPLRFRRMVAAWAGHPQLWWVACPDVVSDAEATAERFATWEPELRGLPLAYVLQDGATVEAVPWAAIVAVFVGGTTPWKLGPQAAALVQEARRRGKVAHMGRVNTMRRLRIAWDLRCASVDGSKFTRWTASHLPRALAEVGWLAAQGSWAALADLPDAPKEEP